ncbi:MAG: hypothetical protein K2G53_09970 [Muribaculaceae bacterium]|nr:hypothetical protein [Muribaculaceae bacterium]
MQNVNENSPASAGWGGARKGAGRKKMEKGKYYGFTSSPDVEAILERVEGSKAAYINEAVRAYALSSRSAPV